MSNTYKKVGTERELTSMKLSEGLLLFSQNYLYQRGYSKSTMDNYRWAVDSLIGVIGDIQLNELTLNHLLEWRHDKDNEAWSINAINSYCYKIRLFLNYWNKKGALTFDTSEFLIPKKEQKLPVYLSLEETKKVFNACRDSRERLIVAMLYSSGIRVGELVKVRISDIRGNKLLIRAKGNKERYVYLDKLCMRCISEYMSHRHSISPYLLDSIKGNGLKKHRIQQLVRELGQRAGLNKALTPHVFRHTYATLLLKQGCQLRYIQELLGHADISTTQIYTHVTNNDLAGAYSKYHVALV